MRNPVRAGMTRCVLLSYKKRITANGLEGLLVLQNLNRSHGAQALFPSLVQTYCTMHILHSPLT